MTNFEMVKEFHEKFKVDVKKSKIYELLTLRQHLIEEEFAEVSTEFLIALSDVVRLKEISNEKHLLKELVDLLYVIYGTAVSLGYDIDGAFKEVHRSNLSKLDDNGEPIFREDGKVLKSSNYTPADVGDYV